MKQLRVILLLIVIITCTTTIATASDNPWYAGTFERHAYRFAKATLEINTVTNEQFNFKIHALSGANMGGVKGIAYIDANTATFDDGKGGTLTFTINNDSIEIKQSVAMHNYAGMGVAFMGSYDNVANIQPRVETTDYFTQCKIFKDDQEQKFVQLVGDNYKKFTGTAHLLFKEDDLDGFGAQVTRMGVRGLFTFMESIIMFRDSDNAIWAAVIDHDKVLYFTNTCDKENIPVTIQNWHKRLRNIPIVVIE